MSAQHTPGPWIWREGHRGLYGAGPNNGVLDYAAYVGMWLSWDQGEKVASANARLIAAAPELLAFAQEFLSDYQSDDGMASMKYYAKQAHAAIAKATGGEA